MDVLILGCGFTGRRVATRFLERGARVMATARDPRKIEDLGVEIVELGGLRARLPKGVLALHSIPPEGQADVIELLGEKPARVVYLSLTGVYGRANVVDENTPIDPDNDRARARIETERAVASGPWSSLILRCAAIYGPGRGAHERIRRGEYRLDEGIVSRIHVDDLAALVEAGMLSAVRGAYPVADEEPCSSREIFEFCARLMGLPEAPADAAPAARKTGNRRVDGSAIRKLLGVTLKYPSFRMGIPAAVAESLSL